MYDFILKETKTIRLLPVILIAIFFQAYFNCYLVMQMKHNRAWSLPHGTNDSDDDDEDRYRRKEAGGEKLVIL